jgi:multidrug efflux system membrane fusion protein
MNRVRPFIILIIVIGVSALGWKVLHKAKPAASKPRAIAVTTSAAENRDVPVWLTGLGTVQANNTVTIRPRVSGELQSIQFTEGQSVKAGDILAQIDPRPYRAALDQALAQKAQDEARLANDRREFERVRALVETNTESRQLLDQRAATLAQSAALVQASQAAAANAQLQLDFTTVRAPIDGLTGVRLVDAGNIVTASQNNGLVVLTQIKPISVVFTVPQQNFLELRRGITRSADSPLPVEALTDSGEVIARGKLDLLDNQIDTATGTLRLKATFPNNDQTLWPGQFLNARVLVQTLTKALVIPAEAVQPGLNGPFAYVVKPDSTAEARTLTIGATVNGLTVITAGLQPGDQVVRDGQNKLQPGARVDPVKPTSTQPAASAPAAASVE